MDTDAHALSAAWLAAQDRLPGGWQLDGLRCASSGLTPEQRSDDWVAVATGPGGARRSYRAADPFDALVGLVAVVGSAATDAASDERVHERYGSG